MKFLHVADIHLGFEQYGVRERFNDFSRTFLWLMDFAREQEVDFVVLAGDLFHKRTVDPLAMHVAVHGLSLTGCPVIAIEGNHEKAYFTDQKSWVDFLDETGSITLVDRESFEMDGVRFSGLKYAGATTDEEVREFLPDIIDDGLFNILLVHAGLEGQLAYAGRLTNETLGMMDHIDYLALGHIHQPYGRPIIQDPLKPLRRMSRCIPSEGRCWWRQMETQSSISSLSRHAGRSTALTSGLTDALIPPSCTMPWTT